MSDQSNSMYGVSVGLFVTRKASGEAVVIGGIGTSVNRWVRILSILAAQALWLQLAQVLYPQRSLRAVTQISPLSTQIVNLPAVTTQVQVAEQDVDHVLITGWVGEKSWQALLHRAEAEQFWSALDTALFPPVEKPEPPQQPT